MSYDAEFEQEIEHDYRSDDDDDEPPPPPPDQDEDDEIAEKYNLILDSLLFPPHVKEHLINTQSKEKKLQIIDMHKKTLEEKKGLSWGDQQNSLLNLINNSRIPNIQDLISLRSSLAMGNKEFLTGFLEADGIYVLMKCIDDRIARLPMTDLDASILFEIINCCKCIMNNDTGMEALLVTPGAIEHIAKSLFFEWKPIALNVLEILSVCCYYSEGSSIMVMDGMKLLSKMRNEAPFAILCQALITEDMEVKATVAQFVNSMIMGMENVQDRNYLRAELTTQLYIDTYESVLRLIRSDLDRLESVPGDSLAIVDSMMTTRKRLVSTTAGGSAVGGSNDNFKSTDKSNNDTSSLIQVGKGKSTVAVNPNNGTMAGPCITISKDQRTFSLFTDKSKLHTQWFELDGSILKSGANRDRDASELKPVVPMANVISIRDFTTDAKLAKEVRFAFEIETTDEVISIGCENAFDKDCWITALTVARDLAVMKRSAYRLISRELTVDEFRAHADMYIKQGTIYFSMLADDRDLVVTSYGLDTGDPIMLSEFLYHEMVAMGQSDQYHELLQLLLLMPPGAPKLWNFLIMGVRRLVSCSISDDDELENSFRIDMNSLVSLLESRAEELGGVYPQVTKLAMSVMNKETELRQMKGDLNHFVEIMERVKGEMHDGLRNVEDELVRNGYNSNLIRQLLLPIAAIPDRLLNENPTDEENQENRSSTRRRRSSITEMRYELYNRMLKSLPEAALIKEKMKADGLSETDIIDFFGIETAMAVPDKDVMNKLLSSLGGVGGLTGVDGEKYKKLLRMLPSSQIREKMLEVGFKDPEIDDVIGPYDPQAISNTANKQAVETKPMDPKYEKYFKMMKMLPEGAVRQKMTTDGLSEKDIEEFFRQLLEVAVATASGATIAAAPIAAPIDPKYEKYIKMSKMLPEGAVRQKMMTEGLTESDIDNYFTVVLPGSKASSSGVPFNQSNNSGSLPSTAASTVAPPSPADPASKYEKYTKMMKMLPEGAVRQKMLNDGLSESEISHFFNKGGPAPIDTTGKGGKKTESNGVEAPPAGMKPKEPIQPAKKMKGLFWTKMKNTEVPGTLWSEIEEFKYPSQSKEVIDTLFAAVTRGVESPEKGANEAAKKEKAKAAAGVSLFDGKRVQGVLIFLGRVRKQPREVVTMILRLDPRVMTQGLTETIITLCPTAEELKLVKSYEAPQNLDLTGQLFYELSSIPRLEQRLKCHEITFKWDVEASDASTSVGVFLKACVELRKTKPVIAKLLSMVLALGNYLNGGTPRGQAYGVKLDFMAKLNTIKMNPIGKVDGVPTVMCGPTLLHFLAMQAEEFAPEVVDIAQNWDNVWLAAEMQFAGLESNVQQLEAQLETAKSEIRIGVQIVQEEAGEAASEPLKQRLTQFIQRAEPRIVNIKTHLIETTATLKTTLALFGETISPTEDAVTHFFGTLSTFIKAFNLCVAENRKIQDDQATAKRRQLEQQRMRETRIARQSMASSSTEDKGIFADFKKSQSRQAEDIINKRRSDRRNANAAAAAHTSANINSLNAKSAVATSTGNDNTGSVSTVSAAPERVRRRRPSLVREEPSMRNRAMGTPKNSLQRMPLT